MAVVFEEETPAITRMVENAEKALHGCMGAIMTTPSCDIFELGETTTNLSASIAHFMREEEQSEDEDE